MSDTDSVNLMTLIRLLHHDLPADEGMRLRESMATDRLLADRLRRVMKADHQSHNEFAAEPSPVLPSAEQIALFVEGQLTTEEETQLETLCEASPALLREVLACWRSENTPAQDDGESISEDRLTEIALDALCAVDAGELTSLTAPTKERRSWDADFGPAVDTQPSRDAEQHDPLVRPATTSSGRQHLPVSVESSSREWTGSVTGNRHGARNRSAAIVVTLLVLMVFVVVSLVQWSPSAEEVVTTPTGVESQSVPRTVTTDGQTDGPDTDVIPLTPFEPRPPRLMPEPDEPRIADQNSGNGSSVSNGMPNKTPEDPPKEPGGPIARSTIEEVRDIAGVVAVQDTDSSAWRGIESRGGRTFLNTSSSVRLLSLLDSRVVLRTAGLGDLVLGTESDVSISAVASRQREDSRDKAAIELKQGRFALFMVDAGSSFALVTRDQHVSCVATETSSLSVESSAGGISLTVYRGSFRVAEMELNRRTAAILTPAGEWKENSVDAASESTAWYRVREFRSSLPADTCEQLNFSDNLSRDAGMLASSRDTSTAFLATQVLLQCAPARQNSAPGPMFYRLASSRVESQRQSAIHWLVGQLRQQPDNCAVVLQQLCSQMQIVTPQNVLLRRWYTAATFGDRPALSNLRELLAGLQNKEHLFVRQSAKYFLQSILGDPLSEYDPARPGDRQAFQSVTRKTRAWQQANL